MGTRQLPNFVYDKCYECYHVEKKPYESSSTCSRCISQYVERVPLERIINPKAYNGTNEGLYTNVVKGNIVKPTKSINRNCSKKLRINASSLGNLLAPSLLIHEAQSECGCSPHARTAYTVHL